MNYFDQIYVRLFGKTSPSSVVRVDHLINRSKSFIKNFNSWKSSDLCDEYLNEIWESYFWRKRGIEKNPAVVLHESTCSNGLAISFEPTIGKNNFHYLFDYLAEQVKLLGYLMVTSKVTIKENGDDVETKELHYLKPKRSFIEPIDQKYGNVQIEYLKLNDMPTRIKLVVNAYPDRKYKEPKSFEDLTKFLFNKST